jgi:S1-C subfamily serine protease
MPCCPFLCVRKFAVLVLVGAAVTLALHAALAADGPALDPRVRTDEAARVAAIAKVQPAVVAIFSANPQAAGQGGGSGVLIDKEGYALTNFHVVQGAGDVMYCGLPDGVLYDAVVVGLDKVGDVALVKLLPKDKGKPFPFAALGDSDTVKAGDWAMALGNPFLLATDFKPTVTFGLVSGIHRYQYPSGTLLEYTDCIQVDTSINPGNSGGPLFNMKGELIGINGRGSFDKRGRVNSGVGYAISINQIKNFLGHLRAGIDTDHATLGAIVETDSEDEAGERLLVRSIIEDSDVRRRGLDVDDELVSFAGRPVTSVNQYKNVLGLYPKGWRVPLVYRRNNVKREILVRLMQLQRTQTPEELARMRQQQPRRQPIPNTPAAKLYEPRPGYANYHFNKVERDRLLAEVAKLGDFIKVGGDWTLEGDFDSLQRKSPAKVMIREEQDTSDTSGKPVIREWTYHLNPKALPPLAEEDRRADQTPLRQSVRKAMELLRKHALAFPQEIWAKDSEARTKEYAAGLQKEAAPRLKELSDALAALQKAAKERDK